MNNIVEIVMSRFKKRKLLRKNSRLSFAQEGEDLVLYRIFAALEVNNGFYVDVGAHHPFRFSNTYFFYQRGWRGINIEARPGSMRLFDLYRSEDINLEIGISDREELLTYYLFNESALNGFSPTVSAERDGKGEYRIIDHKQIPTKTLAGVLDAYLPTGTNIDFLSIDVEGMDFQVLQSNDWNRYRPRVVLVEDLDLKFLDASLDSPVVNYLRSHGYRLFAKTFYTLFFLEEGCKC